jgi:hypothetical protein
MAEKIVYLFLLFIFSCNHKTEENIPKEKLIEKVKPKYEFKNLDSLFSIMLDDTMTFYSDVSPFPKKIVGNVIDSNLFNKYIFPILDKNYDRDYGAICKKTLNDSINVYFIRHGQNSVAKISLLCYNNRRNKFEKTLEIADFIGDEGIEVVLKSKVKIESNSIKIVSRLTIEDNGKIETDSIYSNVIKY